METSTNIFYKIFQIMDHYETILENITYKGEKYKPDNTFNDFMNADEFFSSIFKEVPIKTKEQPPDTESNEDHDTPQEPPNNEDESPSIKSSPDQEELPQDKPKPLSNREQIITKYIKKCYRIIVLKCHPDKNKSHENGSELFMKCQQYYECDFLIGILYVFYLYKLKPPAPLCNTQDLQDDNYTTIVNRILLEMRVIQEKLVQFNSPISDENNDCTV